MGKVRRSASVFVEGVDPRMLARAASRTPIKRLADGRYCRDRLPWGGITEPDGCDCQGACLADKEDRDAARLG